jgi:hypothetical protein
MVVAVLLPAAAAAAAAAVHAREQTDVLCAAIKYVLCHMCVYVCVRSFIVVATAADFTAVAFCGHQIEKVRSS